MTAERQAAGLVCSQARLARHLGEGGRDTATESHLRRRDTECPSPLLRPVGTSLAELDGLAVRIGDPCSAQVVIQKVVSRRKEWRTRGEQRTNRAISVVGPKKRFRSSVSFPLGTKAAGSLASTVAIPRENPSHLSWTDGVADRWRAKMAQQSPVRRRKRPHEEDSASRDLSLARRRQAAPYFRGCSTASQANRPSFSLCAFKGLGFPAPCAAYAALPASSL